MKKRLIATFMAAIGLLAVFTGCEGKNRPSSEEPVTLTMWHVYGSQTKSPLKTAI